MVSQAKNKHAGGWKGMAEVICLKLLTSAFMAARKERKIDRDRDRDTEREQPPL